MKVVPLTPDYELTAFDCGDEQLNNFLFEDEHTRLMFFDMKEVE